MLVSELYDLFRSDLDDAAQPYLWTDAEVYLYMDDAYKQFVKRIGGISDETSALTLVDVVPGQSYAEVSPRILKFELATLVSNQNTLKIVNKQDMNNIVYADYGTTRAVSSNSPGRVLFVVVGIERTARAGKVKWVQQPIVADSVQFSVKRLPLDDISETMQDFDFYEIQDHHHQHLLAWMKHRAYGKQDAESFDKSRRDEYRQEFVGYCEEAMEEAARYTSKPTRVVAYGGI